MSDLGQQALGPIDQDLFLCTFLMAVGCLVLLHLGLQGCKLPCIPMQCLAPVSCASCALHRNQLFGLQNGFDSLSMGGCQATNGKACMHEDQVKADWSLQHHLPVVSKCEQKYLQKSVANFEPSTLTSGG